MSAAVSQAEAPTSFYDVEKTPKDNGVVMHESDNDSSSNDEPKQDGVKKVEAVTTVWSKQMLWVVFGLYVCKIHSLWCMVLR